MSEEEKKATIELNHFSNITAYWKKQEYTNSEINNYIKIVLNLIEKQSKEIEYLKSQIPIDKIFYYSYKDFISKDKIKTKIEEIKHYKNLAKDSIEERIVIADSDSLNYGRKEAHEKDIEVLQELLEE